ncbi:ABC transporter ATP-binding protein [Hominifimenecus sp. rT4P-3]|uniref:ABC transporter ATP-binding protein n=1 Tax=Hominifimenecus sp. rT4P-3 TaxID=3242979 RepID=UPI003DA2E304
MKLEVKNIVKSFEEKEVLHGVSFSVESGRALGLLGRNGAGKTTTIRILMDIFHANSGEVLLDGKPFQPSGSSIGYLPEERGLYPKKTVMEQMIYLGRLRGLSKKQAEENSYRWLNRLGVEEYAKRKLDTLSKGNQQKVQLASTLVSDPEIVVLDEPFSGLDPVNAQILKDVIRELIAEDKLVIFSSHQMSYVEEFCEDIAIVNFGEIVLKGDLREIKKRYGQNRLILSAAGYSLDQLSGFCQEKLGDLVTIDGRTRDYLILGLKENRTRRMLLEELLRTELPIEHFGTYEPSLNDIFVSCVGEEQENGGAA